MIFNISNIIYFSTLIKLDPLDPLTEIIRSGQAFSPFIAIERLIWLFLGIFFVLAISISIWNGIKEQGIIGSKKFSLGITESDDNQEKKVTEVEKENQ